VLRKPILSKECSVGTVGVVADRCPECGAVTDSTSCEDLFHRLLALDHQQEQPWASFHAINVACYALQHPSTTKTPHLAVQHKVVAVFCDDGLPGVLALTASARARNSHRSRGSTVDFFDVADQTFPATAPPHRFTVTIHDVAVDGNFPAAGYTDRVAAWAKDVRAAWSEQAPSE
jgi:hypothetical protein